jgi:hypothetical protein
MHFDPDPLGESELSTLRSFVRLLQRLDEILPEWSSAKLFPAHGGPEEPKA